ncbi:MAG: VOC family protein [Candidatus Zixiibacteriota bacterium]
MSDFNSTHNRAVWFDIPVTDLDRAEKFYSAVLAIDVNREDYDGFAFSILEHKEGNGGCLVPSKDGVQKENGILLYLNANGRIIDAVEKVKENGGEVIEDTHSIGPYGCRAIIRDSEGNRLALHSEEKIG